MAVDLQYQASITASNIIATVAGFADTRKTIGQLNSTYTQLDLASVLGAMPTATQNADGSLTPDSTPQTGHPIDTNKITRLTIALSAYDIGVMLSLLQQVAALLDGNTVAQQTTAPNSLAKATSD